MCSSYAGPTGNKGISGFLKDEVAYRRGKLGIGAGGGINSGGSSGPSAASAAGTAYIRRKAGAPILDSIFGVQNNG